ERAALAGGDALLAGGAGVLRVAVLGADRLVDDGHAVDEVELADEVEAAGPAVLERLLEVVGEEEAGRAEVDAVLDHRRADEALFDERQELGLARAGRLLVLVFGAVLALE